MSKHDLYLILALLSFVGGGVISLAMIVYCEYLPWLALTDLAIPIVVGTVLAVVFTHRAQEAEFDSLRSDLLTTNIQETSQC